MFYVYVENYVDYNATIEGLDAFWGVLWAIAMLTGPCRSGGAGFIKLG